MGLNGESIEFVEVSNPQEPQTLFEGESQETEDPTTSQQTENEPDQFESDTDTISSDTSPLETVSVPAEDSKAISQNSEEEEKSEDASEELTTDSIDLDEAVLNRQLNQLVSDMATSTEPVERTQDMVFIEPVISAGYGDPTEEVDQDALLFS